MAVSHQVWVQCAERVAACMRMLAELGEGEHVKQANIEESTVVWSRCMHGGGIRLLDVRAW